MGVETDKSSNDNTGSRVARSVDKSQQSREKREKQEWADDKLELENSRRLRGIQFLDPEGKDYEETIETARRKLEVHMEAAMPCKKKDPSQFCCQEAVARLDKVRVYSGVSVIYKSAHATDSSKRS